MASVHDGHRARMRDKIRKGGLGSFQQHEILEYLLFSFVPRKDTNEIAHALIDKFSSLSGVLNASEEDLEKVSGMTQNAALFLATLPDVFRAYVDGVNSDGANRQDLSGRGKARNFMCARLFGLNQEHVCVAALDAHDKLIKCEIIEQGSGDSVRLDVRKNRRFRAQNGRKRDTYCAQSSERQSLAVAKRRQYDARGNDDAFGHRRRTSGSPHLFWKRVLFL